MKTENNTKWVQIYGRKTDPFHAKRMTTIWELLSFILHVLNLFFKTRLPLWFLPRWGTNTSFGEPNYFVCILCQIMPGHKLPLMWTTLSSCELFTWHRKSSVSPVRLFWCRVCSGWHDLLRTSQPCFIMVLCCHLRGKLMKRDINSNPRCGCVELCTQVWVRWGCLRHDILSSFGTKLLTSTGEVIKWRGYEYWIALSELSEHSARSRFASRCCLVLMANVKIVWSLFASG